MNKPKVKKSVDIIKHIDGRRKVRVYKNLHKNCYSVQQDGVVMCHASRVALENVKFIVYKAGQERVRKEKRKNVHAYIEGFVIDTRYADNMVDGHKSDEELDKGRSDWENIYYNPYECDGFINTSTERIAESAEFVTLEKNEQVIYASNVIYTGQNNEKV